MLTLSLAKCINATKNGAFTVKDLDLSAPLSYEDVLFLAEYLKVTPVTDLDLSMTITRENSKALGELSQVIAKNSLLQKLTFEATLNFDFYFKHNLPIGWLDFIDDYRLKKIVTPVYEALVDMLKNKPALNMLTVDFLAMETPIDNKHINRLARAINKIPLQYLNLGLSVAKEAHIPLLKTKEPNQSLEFLILRGFNSGRSVLKYLPQTSVLKMLAIDDMQFETHDLKLLDAIMKSNASLDTLILGKTNLGQINSPDALTWLRACLNLNSLILIDNNLSRLNVDSLCEFLANNPQTLKKLDLSKNAYMGDDAIKLAKALTINTHIETLVLDDNYIENEGLQAIIKLVKTNKNITSLSISNTCRYTPSNEIIDSLCDLLRDPECQLKELKFNQDITLAQYLMLQYALDSNKTLQFVDFKFRNQNILEAILGKNNSSDLNEKEFSTDNTKKEVSPNTLNTDPTSKSAPLFFISSKSRLEENENELPSLPSQSAHLH
ncbi:type IV secretion protein Dot [Legionella pneumophila]|uniref:Dot/Icm secretion system substrate n=1 Tax=Legionella pneumophila subsp. pascullei TaxID=91890 RepID=A0AAX2IVM3_LEGPN|nr:type IV secretion protein Dot [Legionella pneumophila]AMP89689.1 type IV secretion protein Dot [Legionella pneumophila subsp. pascullei]AMP92645.1 type IV secretion protein Dot [Legionella pneumophila subsp. pascullei]AMP95610.1 type IV secretion protein Dot [Legionella pneumophila subsp. pascullei]SQG90520.1 Dot/Icm secretion system substrate [Legionella pneumophila subsp. pascullei]VEH06873.1 Dot/Icm secretion system substrate [Legionella pneumophila subsp. pascullei]